MAELKTKPTNASVSDFLNAIKSEEVRNDCKAIASMLEAATKTKPEMWGPSIIGFGRYQYAYPSGRSLEWMKIGFSPRKQNIVLYIAAGLDPHADLLAELGEHSRGVGCLYIKRLSDVHVPTLKKLVKRSLVRVNELEKANRSAQGKGR